MNVNLKLQKLWFFNSQKKTHYITDKIVAIINIVLKF